MLRFLIILLKISLFLGFIGIGCAGYVLYYYSKDLPDYSQLKAYHPPCITRIYSSDGKLIEEYSKENRVFVPISSLPKSLIEAFIAAEDKNYYSHPGIDLISIVRASINNIPKMMNNQRVEGGSTITQQVVKNFLLTSQRSLDRKIKEAILSYRISQTLSKDEILELYLNQIYLGKRAYGVAAAASVYFNKSVEELTINESATLAALPKAPGNFDPTKNYKRAFNRKNYVINRMYEDGYITQEEALAAIKEPIVIAKRNKLETVDADYYAEQVREEVINMFGTEYFYTAGLTIITCLDSKAQYAAERSLINGITDFDRKRGYRGPWRKINLNADKEYVVSPGSNKDSPKQDWQEELERMVIPAGLRNDILAVVLKVEDKSAIIGFKDGSKSNLSISDMKWTKTALKSVKQILEPGDVIAVSKVVVKTTTNKSSKNNSDNLKSSGYQYILSQIPQVNGGFFAMENATGKVLAMQGGYDFDASKFNRVTQAQRQIGSLVKTFVYLAGLENGLRPNDIFEDAPIAIPQGAGLPTWQPKNWDDKFLGKITFRKAFEKSRNTVTVRIGLKVGLKKVAETIRRFGVNDSPMNVNSILLGAVESTLEKVTTAFAIIANNGKKITPHYIELIKDRKGNIIYRRDSRDCLECKDYAHDHNGNIMPPEISPEQGVAITDVATSYQMISMLNGVTQRGTATSLASLGKIIAGKTGTTNDAKDTWFIGFTPKIIAGTFIGYDQPRSLGNRAYGANIPLPIFKNFFQEAYDDVPNIDFIVPDTIKLVQVDYDTGSPSTRKQGSIVEAFKANIYNPSLREYERYHSDEEDVFSKIQDLDASQEIY